MKGSEEGDVLTQHGVHSFIQQTFIEGLKMQGLRILRWIKGPAYP